MTFIMTDLFRLAVESYIVKGKDGISEDPSADLLLSEAPRGNL